MFGNVIIAIDGGPGGRDAIALARRLAAPDATLTLAHVYASGIAVAPSVLVWDEVDQQRAVKVLRAERARLELDVEVATIGAMSVGEGLHRLAERLHGDLLVVGSSRRGVVGRVLMGDDTRESLNGAPCAVAVASRDAALHRGRFARIGVGYDGGPESERALDAAREIAERDASEIEVVQAVHAPLAFPRAPTAWSSVQPDMFEAAARTMAELPGVTGTAVLGEPKEVLARLGQDVDLLVVGSRGYGPLGRMIFGSTAAFLQRHAPCPVLVVRRGTAVVPGAPHTEAPAVRTAGVASPAPGPAPH